ncbi:hypothetical protein PC129_g1036 [Phytophthora cactorum]|uniref:Transmembrane protein 135 N-terminal domain-containing protein n=1 Tax=Phytophthora cactorum TaxID=29920 RepID=A0A8T1IZY5_9STRA|nr:hypothetical protein PC129_g1036 [Phytophthora cactorum]
MQQRQQTENGGGSGGVPRRSLMSPFAAQAGPPYQQQPLPEMTSFPHYPIPMEPSIRSYQHHQQPAQQMPPQGRYWQAPTGMDASSYAKQGRHGGSLDLGEFGGILDPDSTTGSNASATSGRTPSDAASEMSIAGFDVNSFHDGVTGSSGASGGWNPPVTTASMHSRPPATPTVPKKTRLATSKKSAEAIPPSSDAATTALVDAAYTQFSESNELDLRTDKLSKDRSERCQFPDCPNRARVSQSYGKYCNRHVIVAPCGFPGCRDKAMERASMCATHMEQGKEALQEILNARSQNVPVCKMSGCFKNDQGRGYCRGHEKLLMATGRLPPHINKRRLNSAYTMCSYPDCNKHSQRHHLCRTHGNLIIKQAQELADRPGATESYEEILGRLHKEIHWIRFANDAMPISKLLASCLRCFTSRRSQGSNRCRCPEAFRQPTAAAMERIYSAFFTSERRREPPELTAAVLELHNETQKSQRQPPLLRPGGDGGKRRPDAKDESPHEAKQHADARRQEMQKMVMNWTSVKKDLEAACQAAARAFLLAYGAKAFTAVLLASRKWSSLEYGYADAARLLLKGDTLRFGAFFGSLVGIFRVTELVTRAARGGERDVVNLAIAGAVSGSALLLDSPSRRNTISLYIFVRMLDVVCRHLMSIGVLPTWRYSSEMLFALSNAAIMYAFVADPSLLPKGYYQWICRIGAVNHHGLEYTIRQRMRGQLDVHGNPLPFRLCQPHYHMESCVTHAIKEWINGLGRSMQIYLPVHFLPAMFFRFQQLQGAPVSTTARISYAALCSSAFLTSYQTAVKLVVCTARNAFHRDFAATSLAAGVATGGALFFEHTKRRFELMLYCFPRALDIVWQLLKRRGLVRYVKHSEVVLFCLSMSLIMSSPARYFKPTYLRILRFIFGGDII